MAAIRGGRYWPASSGYVPGLSCATISKLGGWGTALAPRGLTGRHHHGSGRETPPRPRNRYHSAASSGIQTAIPVSRRKETHRTPPNDLTLGHSRFNC